MTTEPRRTPLRLYTAVDEHPPLAWSWVEQQLRDAGTYWVVGHGGAYPPTRPVWGIWHEEAVHLSIGSPAVRSAIADDPRVTVHLDSGTEVVLVEGTASVEDAKRVLRDVYDAKYDWVYDASTYGPFTRVEPSVVKAWRTAGFAGRDSFQETGRWKFTSR
jgi:hypothetical protein